MIEEQEVERLVEEWERALAAAMAAAESGTPADVREAVESVEQVARTFEKMKSSVEQLGRTLKKAEQRARAEEERRRLASERPIEFGEVIATNLRRVRNGAEWTQEALAAAMDRLGFGWRRVTVAEVEGATRKVTLEELVGLCGLYGIPLLQFLLPLHGAHVRFAEGRAIDALTLAELLLGEGGQIGEGGPSWSPALRVTLAEPGEEDWRPAQALWTPKANRRWRGAARDSEED